MNANIKGAVINVVELLIVLFCGAVLIITTMNGQPSETIIGIFGGYLGVAYKNAAANNKPAPNTSNTGPGTQIVLTPEEEPPKPTPETDKKSIFDKSMKKGT